MVKTRGGSTTGNWNERGQTSRTLNRGNNCRWSTHPAPKGENVVGEKKDGESEQVSGDGEAFRPRVKETSCETRYKFARNHSSIEPTVAEVLVGPRKAGVVTTKGGRVKKGVRKQGVHVRCVVNSDEEVVDSPREIQESDDDIVIVYSTASRRRTRGYVTELEKKKMELGLGGDVGGSVEPSEAADLEEMERKAEEKRRTKKGKGKAKKPRGDRTLGGAFKKRKWVVISEPKSSVRGDRFLVDDVVESDEEGDAKALREMSKDKMKINDNRNRINNRRIAKDVEEEHLAREVLSEVTYNNQTYIDILQDAGLLGILSEIGSHWPQLVREFVCNVFEEIVDLASSMFHKNEGITGATLKLRDIIRELTGKALTTWPSKGQLRASSLSLMYAVLHKAAIANFVSTLNNTNVSEAVTGAKLKTIEFPTLICRMLITQHPHVLKKGDGLGEDAKSLTISDKLMKGNHVIDVDFNAADQTEHIPEGEAAEMLIKAYEEEQQRPEAEIQTKKVSVNITRTNPGSEDTCPSNCQ
ncbi:hypothetical protein LIER_19555 [Lithospermum erythrorhizon]|uniref:Uncharacterized protein n=1 Tax=Lithospermum erythrorhizon TaxID=34254 RepID=A0AAV3QKS0_LITER